jgi:hypothetical protein
LGREEIGQACVFEPPLEHLGDRMRLGVVARQFFLLAGRKNRLGSGRRFWLAGGGRRDRGPARNPNALSSIKSRVGKVDAPPLPSSRCISTCGERRSCQFRRLQSSYRYPRPQWPRPSNTCRSSVLLERLPEDRGIGFSFITGTLPF